MPHGPGTDKPLASVEAAVQLGLPVVKPKWDADSEDLPTICLRAAPVLDARDYRKLFQPHYWGSRAWRAITRLRTYVEGSYGNRKNDSTENMRRGHTRTGGVGMAQLLYLGGTVAYNVRMVRNWHTRTGKGDPNHPLLTEDDSIFGYLPVTDATTATATIEENQTAA